MTQLLKDSGDEAAQINNNYIKHYISRLLGNALLVIFFTVMTFTDSVPCRDEQDRYYVTDWFDAAFSGGFILNAANFLYYAFGAPASA